MAGLKAALGARFPDSTLLLDDTFDEGQAGWHQLYDQNVPRGILGLSCMPALKHRSLSLTTTDQRNGGALDTYPWSVATALKRTLRPHPTLSKVHYEAWWALRPLRGRDGSGTVSIEIDTADNNGHRRFYRLRWIGYEGDKIVTATTTSGSAVITDAQSRFLPTDVGKTVTGTGIPGATTILSVQNAGQATLSANATANGTPQLTLVGFYSNRWELSTSQTFQQQVVLPSINVADMTNNPADSYLVPYNENKPGWMYCAMEVDITNDRYLGVRAGTVGKGSLAQTPDTAISDLNYGGVQSSLSGFGNGLNFGITVENRADADSAQTAFLGRARATLKGAAL